MDKKIQLSVIVPISERHDPVLDLHAAYRDAVRRCGMEFEFVYVLDGDFPEALADLSKICNLESNVRVVKLARWFGEATALSAGAEHARGDLLMTLPAYRQVATEELPRFIEALGENDMVIARRSPRADPKVNRVQSRVFHWLVGLAGGQPFRDLGCGVRIFRRRIVDEVPIYGDQHRFLPLLANRHGFRIEEIGIAQDEADRFRRTYSPGVYMRRLLDILTIFFLIKFTKKPLRFFGLVGASIAGFGALVLFYVVMQRLLFDISLAERPALLLSSLLVVLGVQVFALGLLGELIIFAHARDIKEYTVERILGGPAAESGVRADSETQAAVGSDAH